ncbi:MAG TPA: N-acetyltransferase [Phycisphaerales bacterium]|nr:N-acetyltransferase [Phycisphaerales bacterium]
MTQGYFAHETSVVDDGSVIGEGTNIWHFSHIMNDVQIGKNCNFGQSTFVGPGVTIGNNVKVQNNVSIYPGAVVEDDVFLGPSCVLTNVTNPRSQVVRRSIYEKTILRRGATVGANATIVCGIELGRYCFIAAGAVVAMDVPDYALMIGVPGRQLGWISRHGIRLPQPDSEGIMVCQESGYRYKEIEAGVIRCLDLNEESPLPADKSVGKITYDDFKKKQHCFVSIKRKAKV